MEQEIVSSKLLESAIELNLAMSFEERIEAHENALRLLNDLKLAGEDNRAKSQGPALFQSLMIKLKIISWFKKSKN